MPLSLRESLLEARDLPADPHVLLDRIHMLSQQDAEMMEAILVRGASAASVARLMQVDERSIRKRVAALARRLGSPPILEVARAMPHLGIRDQKLAVLNCCQRVSIAEIARRSGKSQWAVRKALSRVRAKIDAVNATLFPAARQHRRPRRSEGVSPARCLTSNSAERQASPARCSPANSARQQASPSPQGVEMEVRE